MKNLFVIITMLCAVIPLSPRCYATDALTDRIMGFLDTLENKPTLASCERLVMGEAELILEGLVCEERGWIPKGSREMYPRCVEFTNKRAQNDDNPCLYLMWLRSKFPTNPATFEVLKSEYSAHYGTHEVKARLNDVIVDFVLPDRDTFGDIDVRRINGEYVFDILKKDVEEGFSPSIYLEESSREGSQSR